MKTTRGKGVLAKDGKTPFAACTLHVTHQSGGTTWTRHEAYTMTNLLDQVLALSKGEIDSIQLIDENNVRTVLKRTADEDRSLKAA